jgi:hypothetical protein
MICCHACNEEFGGVEGYAMHVLTRHDKEVWLGKRLDVKKFNLNFRRRRAVKTWEPSSVVCWCGERFWDYMHFGRHLIDQGGLEAHILAMALTPKEVS